MEVLAKSNFHIRTDRKILACESAT